MSEHQTIPYIHRINPVIHQYEPARANRFILTTLGTEIPNYQLRSYDFGIHENNFTFEISFHDLVSFTFNPENFYNITGFLMEYIDPVGVVYNTLNLEVVDHLSYSKSGDYSDDTITTNYAKFLIRLV